MSEAELAGGFAGPPAARCRATSRAGSRTTTCAGSGCCRGRPGSSCCWRRPTRPGTPRCCGGPRSSWDWDLRRRRLGQTPLRPDLARAHLLYGEWLRRENRRFDARHQLRAAYDLLDAIGAGAFAERARRELLATGEKVRKREVDTYSQLTSQEVFAKLGITSRRDLNNTAPPVRWPYPSGSSR
jgi:hypothetical protein